MTEDRSFPGGVLPIRSMRDRCSASEWEARVDLAACYRLVDLYGMSDMMANHISMRVPGEETFLINPYGMMYEEITASCLIKVDLAGTIVSKPAPETPMDAYLIAECIEEAGLPKGVFNVVPAGRETGDYLVRHPE